MTDGNNSNDVSAWKKRTYVLGTVLGALMGFTSAYLFAREAEDDMAEAEERPDVPPTAMLGLLLSAVTLIRQIAEAGRRK